ncbi:MAG: AsmA family protein [Pseudomonadota bacterium]
MKAIKYALLGLIGVIGMLVSMFGPVKVPFAEGLAKTYYRYAFGGILVVLLLITIVFGLFLITFDANNFKSEIIQFVKDRTQRELVLQGDIKVTFFPKLGLDSGKLSLSQRNSAKEFASVNNARLYIAWLPLFKRQLVFNRVEIDGIHANVVRLKDGSTNFDDLLISDEHLAPMTFNIDIVRITNSSINWQDELESQRLSLHDLQIETGRLADMAPSNLAATFQLDSEKTHFNSTVQLKSRLFFDRKAGRYEFADIEGKLQGDAGPVSNLALDFKASLDTYPAQGSFTLEDLVVNATGKYSQHDLVARLVAPSLKAIGSTYNGSQLTLDASLTQSKEISTFSLQLPAFESAHRIFNAAELSADFDYKGDTRALHGKLTTPFSINFEATPVFQLGDFALSLTGKHPILSDELTANIKGNAQLDYAEQTAKIVFNAKIDDSHITGTVSLKEFDRPVYAVDISNNHLDLNRYLAGEWIRHLQDDATTFNTAGLRDLILQGSLRSGEIKIDKLKVSKLAANLKIEKSNITLSPFSAHLYGGALTGNISVTANETPTVTVNQSLRGMQVGALLAGTPNADRLAGKGSLYLDMGAQGGSIGALRRSLSGNVSLALAQGTLAGINLRSALIEGKSDLGTKNAERSLPANFAEKTQFSELKANFIFKDGKVGGTGFEMKSPLIRTAGEGEIDLDSGNLNYRLNVTISSAINRRTAEELIDFKGVTVPIRVSGPYATPNIAFDFAASTGGNVANLVAANAAKEAAAKAVAEAASAPIAGQQQKKNSGLSAPSKSKKPAGKPVSKLQP